MVPFDGARFRVAVNESGLGLAGLLEKLNHGQQRINRSSKQAIHHHYQEKGIRIRAKVRARLAEVLDTPEEWLAGEDVQLNFRLYYSFRGLINRSLRISFALTRLDSRVYGAIERDLAAAPERRWVSNGEVELEVHKTMSAILVQLINTARGTAVMMDRQAFLFVEKGLPPVHGQQEPFPMESPLLAANGTEPIPPIIEEAYLVSIRAVSVLLDPWVLGEQPLNYAALLNLGNTVNPAGGRIRLQNADATNRTASAHDGSSSMSPYVLVGVT